MVVIIINIHVTKAFALSSLRLTRRVYKNLLNISFGKTALSFTLIGNSPTHAKVINCWHYCFRLRIVVCKGAMLFFLQRNFAVPIEIFIFAPKPTIFLRLSSGLPVYNAIYKQDEFMVDNVNVSPIVSKGILIIVCATAPTTSKRIVIFWIISSIRGN